MALHPQPQPPIAPMPMELTQKWVITTLHTTINFAHVSKLWTAHTTNTKTPILYCKLTDDERPIPLISVPAIETGHKLARILINELSKPGNQVLDLNKVDSKFRSKLNSTTEPPPTKAKS